ncbi:5-bromo-4-chloroindolyl phosphate hydrolysis family protein [Fusibacter sp. 3D3]|uniref:5-bromo-4-chloroindolyl phosphate hydrolysis family protein n=1 Tax=Fusibacter sp. 3D3 TaxID=1048380 RepID=UPI000853419A|nr:5-bromo-4-chloroindolyl phosphate hydrolysis family protein [Fusibacter sp. 3D3]GAU78825.1 hypothetical protein F3D3_3460 [Fusibacter sp. 3D3]
MKKKGMTDILSGLTAGGVFLLFYLLLRSNVFISLGLGILSFIGGQFLFPKKEASLEFIVDGLTRADVDEVIRAGKEKVNSIEKLNKSIGNTQVQDEIYSICATANAIFEDFKEDPKDVKTARKFLSYYLDTTERILDRYVMISNKKIRDGEIDVTLTKVEEMLSLIDETFKKQMRKLLEDDILDLDVELEVLEKTIKAEGI